MSILISHESPLQLLCKSLDYNDFQYILPFFYKRYPKYKEFMDKYEGLKFCDNGLFEGETYTVQEQIQLIQETKCDIWIVQDTWNDATMTLKDAKYWMSLKNNGVLPQKLNLMVVIQGKTFSEMELLYQQCLDLGYRHFAFNHSSIAYQNEIISIDGELTKSKVGRIELIKRLWNKNIMKQNHYIHLLGSSDPTEFAYYNKALPGVVDSLDTSSPIIFGCNKIQYDDDNIHIKCKDKMEVFFDKELSSQQEDCILENIKIFKQIINGK